MEQKDISERIKEVVDELKRDGVHSFTTRTIIERGNFATPALIKHVNGYIKPVTKGKEVSIVYKKSLNADELRVIRIGRKRRALRHADAGDMKGASAVYDDPIKAKDSLGWLKKADAERVNEYKAWVRARTDKKVKRVTYQWKALVKMINRHMVVLSSSLGVSEHAGARVIVKGKGKKKTVFIAGDVCLNGGRVPLQAWHVPRTYHSEKYGVGKLPVKGTTFGNDFNSTYDGVKWGWAQ